MPNYQSIQSGRPLASSSLLHSPGPFARSECAAPRARGAQVCTANEEGAAAAAFAYARARGLAVVLVDNACSMKVLDCLSQLGYAEHAPILVISGTPGVEEIAAHGPQLPWSQNSQMPTDIPLRMFKQVGRPAPPAACTNPGSGGQGTSIPPLVVSTGEGVRPHRHCGNVAGFERKERMWHAVRVSGKVGREGGGLVDVDETQGVVGQRSGLVSNCCLGAYSCVRPQVF